MLTKLQVLIQLANVQPKMGNIKHQLVLTNMLDQVNHSKSEGATILKLTKLWHCQLINDAVPVCHHFEEMINVCDKPT